MTNESEWHMAPPYLSNFISVITPRLNLYRANDGILLPLITLISSAFMVCLLPPDYSGDCGTP